MSFTTVLRYLKQNIRIISLSAVAFALSVSCVPNDSVSQTVVGGPCEGCEAIYEYGSRTLTPVDTVPGFDRYQPRLKISGTIWHMDGKTPAEGVILYVYQTNPQGIYETRGGEKGWARRHGMNRGWIQTGKDGRYAIYSFRPGAYPGGQESEHIHLTVKEPGKNEYYIDEIAFDDDPLLTSEKRGLLQNRGGSGVVELLDRGGILTAKRDIYLGRNIPNYN